MNQAIVRPTNLRWRVLAWMCSLSAITYIGRLCIMQVRENIEFSLGLTPSLTAYAFSAFSLSYAFFEMPVGWFGDKLGPRRILTRVMWCWIGFSALTGAAWSLASLVVFRFLFGAGEAGAFPNIGSACREWFPFRERGYAQGMVWMFARFGGAIAPPLMLLLSAGGAGWRLGFLGLSALGLLWVWKFAGDFRDTPQEDPRVNHAELSLIAGGRKDPGAPAPLSWRTMLASPTLWCLSLMYFGSNAGWSFFATWITPYLQKDIHLSGATLALASGVPSFFGGFACLLGGLMTDQQVRLLGRRWGRTLLGFVSYGLGGVFLLIALVETRNHAGVAFAALCVSFFVKDLGMASSWATAIDIGHRYSGTVAGFMNTVGNLAQVITVPLVAHIATRAGTPDHPNWKATLYYYAAMFLMASVSWLFVNPRRVIVYSEEDQQRLRTAGQLE
jgi:MFS transporter, ACS family, glucarate transporter